MVNSGGQERFAMMPAENTQTPTDHHHELERCANQRHRPSVSGQPQLGFIIVFRDYGISHQQNELMSMLPEKKSAALPGNHCVIFGAQRHRLLNDGPIEANFEKFLPEF